MKCHNPGYVIHRHKPHIFAHCAHPGAAPCWCQCTEPRHQPCNVTQTLLGAIAPSEKQCNELLQAVPLQENNIEDILRPDLKETQETFLQIKEFHIRFVSKFTTAGSKNQVASFLYEMASTEREVAVLTFEQKTEDYNSEKYNVEIFRYVLFAAILLVVISAALIIAFYYPNDRQSRSQSNSSC